MAKTKKSKVKEDVNEGKGLVEVSDSAASPEKVDESVQEVPMEVSKARKKEKLILAQKGGRWIVRNAGFESGSHIGLLNMIRTSGHSIDDIANLEEFSLVDVARHIWEVNSKK